MNPFEWITAVNEKKDVEFDSSYEPYVVNRGLSMHQQTIFYANCMNENYILPKEEQFDFYMNAIPKGKRFSKWQKGESDEDIEVLQQFYHINKRVAKQYLAVLTTEQLDMIKEKLKKGGR